MAVANSRPGTYCQLVSEEMDIFSPSDEKQNNSCPTDNKQHHQGWLMTGNSSLQKERHGQEIWQWHRMPEDYLLGTVGAVWNGQQISQLRTEWWPAGCHLQHRDCHNPTFVQMAHSPALAQERHERMWVVSLLQTLPPQDTGSHASTPSQLSRCLKTRLGMNDFSSQKRFLYPKL